MDKKEKIIVSIYAAIPLVLITVLLIWVANTDAVITPKLNTIYEPCNESTSILCPEGSDSFISGEFGDNPVRVKVEGTIYRNVGNITVYASCTDDLGHGLDSNASVIIYDKYNSTFVNWTPMETFSGFNHKYIGPVPQSDGNYFVIVNCTSGEDWGLGYAEFQVPDWLLILLNATNRSIGDVTIIINQSNTTLLWLNKIMEFWGIKTDTCLTITNEVPIQMNRGETWEIRTQVTDEYGTSQSNADVWCNITTNFWGQSAMDYSVETAKFIYFNYLNTSGTLEYNVSCEEWNHEGQITC